MLWLKRKSKLNSSSLASPCFEAMTTQFFDKFNKCLFQELLSPFGQVIPNMAVLGGERMIDVFFAPHPGAVLDSDELGRLALMGQKPALFEPFRSALTDNEVQNCLMKLYMVCADLEREYPTVSVTEKPFLWIVAAEVSDRLLTDFGGIHDAELGEGFYRFPKGFGGAIVVVDELPVVSETLWMRLLGKGQTQIDAIEELILLPESDPKRTNILNLTAAWHISIEVSELFDREEERIAMALSQTYLEWEKKTKREGIEQGIERGRAETLRSTVLGLMQLRYGAVDEALEAIVPRLMAMENVDMMRLLLESSRDEIVRFFD
jgi:hypothetical protein